MDLMQWHDDFSVGVNIIDRQHQQLFSIINELIVAVNSHQQEEVLNRLLTATLEYVKIHFQTEEGFFEIHPKFKAHHTQHQDFEKFLRELSFSFLEDKQSLSDKLLNKLTSWLLNHVLKTDLEFFSDLGFRPKVAKEDFEERLHLLTRKDKVLIVDDSRTELLILRRNLEDAGFEVFEATDGKEALKIVDANFDLHLIVTDIHMPGVDGYDLIKAVRDRQLPAMYIIVVTVLTDRDSLLKSFSLGANDFLTKPIFHQELHLRLRNGMRLLRLESQDELIFSMAGLADCRSPETGRHLERVKKFTHLLGMQLMLSHPELGITESIINDISRVSPLHDIGKVAIADGILNKPGKLSPDEFNLMKKHSQIGGDLISKILRKTPSRSLRLAYELTMYHHERWDGSGYPLGLIGNDIPVAARIMAVADVYDALTSKRVYKNAFSRKEAKSIIINSAESHFDPFLVATFERVEGEMNQLREELHD